MRIVLAAVGLVIGAVVVVIATSFPTDGVIAGAKEAVGRSLFDPYSAIYDEVRVHEAGGTKLVCGTVNAKNRMGGYVGAKPFLYNARSNLICIVNSHRDAFLCGEILKRCFPDMRVPTNAATANRWDRGLVW